MMNEEENFEGFKIIFLKILLSNDKIKRNEKKSTNFINRKLKINERNERMHKPTKMKT